MSANGRAGKALPEILTTASNLGLKLDIHQTSARGEGAKFLSSAQITGYDGVIAAGGDGTLYETVNGWISNSSDRKPPIGILPLGTGNSVAIDLGLPSFDIKKALELVRQGKSLKTDVGKFGCENQIRYFINILGLGFVTDVGLSAVRYKKFGRNAYTFAVLEELLRLKGIPLRLTVDGTILQRTCIFTEVSNSRYTGADFLMAPGARLDDGLLDVTILNTVGRLKLLQYFPSIFKGEHIHKPEVETIQARKIIIESDVPKLLAPDGEHLGSTPVSIECLPGAVELFRS